jgi:uncharacterized cupredoxin-like copper-binding protein
MKPNHPASLLGVAAIACLVAACSGAASVAPSVAAPASVAPAGGPIAVEVKEWTVTPSSATAKAGSITFNVKNGGSAVHEFVVVKTDLKADALPVTGSTIDETKLTPVDEIEDIAVGATPTLTVTLAAGHYVLLCNIETHYGLGMHADFDVS